MKIVNKPWGYEKWLHEGKYVFKEIFMKAGFKSSLQYHEFKEESNYVVSGEGEVQLGLLRHVLEAGKGFHVQPRLVHQVTAETDLLMIEASTPEVDDVIRLEDDFGRGNGRIESEHT